MSAIDTHLTAVTVYPDRARLVRNGSASLQPGTQQIEIPNLPIQMDPDTLRVTARGSARAKLLGVQVKRKYYTETPAVQARELEEQIEALQDERGSLEGREVLLKGSRARLDSLGGHTDVFATALASGEMSIEAQLAMFESLRQRAGQVDSELQELAVLKRKLDSRLQQLKKQLDELRSARPRERFIAIVEVEILEKGKLDFELSYIVSGASWKPLYDLRLEEKEGENSLVIGYLAQVAHQSGEDWENVGLALSTARPALAATLPELDPWYIYPRPSIVRKASFVSDEVTPVAMGLHAAVPAPAEREALPADAVAEVVMAKVDTSGAAVTYQIPGTVSVPADGAPHKVNITSYELKPEMDYVTAPKIAEAAYRRAKAANDSQYTLLAGEANLFAGDEFIGATNLEFTAPQGAVELYFGVDDRIKVERKLVRREVDKSSLIGGKRRTRYGYEISIENLLSKDSKINLHDQLPVSRHEDIKVRLENSEPRPINHNEMNLLEWELVLAPKDKIVVRFDFTIDHPQALNVVGLP